MKRLAAALVSLLLLAVLGLWLGPRLVDWEPWRGRLAELASDRLGRTVTLDGPVELLLLPQPMVRAGGVAIGDPGEEFSVTAQLLRVRLDLGALLAGRLAPREIALVGAELTLPWPPGALLTLRPPAWITELDARVENSRVRIGDAVLEGVNARLTSAGLAQAIESSGSFTWAGRAARFSGTLGRPGWDGVATLELSLTLPEASGTARGVLVPGAGFEGSVEARGPDLAALMAGPAVPFRLAGRLNASAELIAADQLVMDVGGVPARGSIALRLLPAPRLDVALVASRLDLDGWVAALRQGAARPVPMALDLSAEAGSFQGVALRRIRGAATLEDGRLTLTDVSLLLPGEAEMEFAGATAGGRLELRARFAGPDMRATLGAVGLPVEELDPGLLRRGEGRFRLVLEEAQAAIPELAATLGDIRLSGAGVLRHGPRPALGIGLTMDRLDLARWLPQGLDPAQASRALGPVDLNLRLAADRVTLGEAVMERASLDGALENGRLTLRRLSGRLADTDVAASGVLALGPQLRLQDLTIEASGSSGRGVMGLVPGEWPDRTAIAGMPLALRLSGGGTLDALALRGGAEIGELRLEATGTLDLPQRKGSASITLRHPGAPRLLAEAFRSDAGSWLGEGSFSLIASLAAGPQGVSAESFELVAGAMRARGALALALGGRPRLTGRLSAERLPLPFVGWRSGDPLGLEALAGIDGEVALEAARLEIAGIVAEQAQATVKLAEGRMAVEAVRARLAGGELEAQASLAIDARSPPRLTAEGRLAGASIAGPLFGVPVDLTAGRGDTSFALSATGHAPSALLGTLEGQIGIAMRDGVVAGFDLAAAAQATTLADPIAAERATRRALLDGATAFDRLDATGRLTAGRLRLEDARLAAEGGATATIGGEIDLARSALDLHILSRPAVPEAPDLGLRLTGPADGPRALPETAAWARWRAAQ
ncbi:AsmA family protein [Roseomonas stagni]|uniref:AsmA family protein n=1 Tax=Falsiroseomonas algicola TaxID=2716930 RepID=A0A6M1LI43_9PROT|nr:AsmA family protein [Falsiroseomonas algicola]NGM19976.1 AsmA family protein [Falsiroseomonas algicola]